MLEPSSPHADGTDATGATGAETRRLAAQMKALQAELARIRANERMYRFSAELSGRLVWAADAKGDMIALDHPFVAITGRPEKDGLGIGWLGVVHPDDRKDTERRWRRAVRTGELYSAEFRIRLADGGYRLMRSRAQVVSGEDGSARRWYGTVQDIEDEHRAEQARREAEERLRQSEELHRYTLELSRQIVWTVDAQGRLLTISPRFRELTGLDPETPLHMAIHPEDREMVLARWVDSEAGGHPYHVQYRLCMADGSYRHMRARAAPRRDEQGRVLCWYGTLEDIHLQREADFARRDVETRYRLAVQATNDAVWDYDIVQKTIGWSDNAGEIFGFPKGPLGHTSFAWWTERIHPEERLRVTGGLAAAIESGESRWSDSYRFLKEDGSYADVLDRGFVIRAADGTPIRAVGAMADLTERHRAEAEIRRMQAELIHVSRVSAMGTMASTLAHELNQPLTALSNFISGAKRLAERPEVPRAALAEALEAAESGALRAGEILRRLRELVSRGKVSVQIEHLPQLIEEACVLAFVDEHALGVRHRLELDPAAAWVRADRVQIQQVLINLVRNAVEAMATSVRREIAISTRLHGNLVEVEVADTGAGIAAEHLDSLFSEFMTTKSGGMGLGLPISRTIVEAQGGKIRAENRAGGGAAFTFTLPRARRRAEKPARL